MKAHLLYKDRDFDFGEDMPPNHEDLVQDLELATLFEAMAAGDRFLFDVSMRTLLASLDDPAVIRFRQHILADCIEHPDVIREMYAIAVGALRDTKGIWGGYGGNYQTPTSSLAGAVRHLQVYIARLKQLRQFADRNASTFESEGLCTLLSSLQRELDDDYLADITFHLEALHFRGGVLISAELDRDNSGINLMLRKPRGSRTTWKSRLGIGPRMSYSFALPPRDEAGGQVLNDLTNRGVNLVADAAAQSSDHVKSYFSALCWELGFYVSCLNLNDQLAENKVPISFPDPAPVGPPVLSCVGLRDVSLALRLENPVVGNDVVGERKSLIIVTGANSGGKSTFLRSVGQAQLMMQCGLFVTAQSYTADVARGVFTHFIREEDRSMTSGRLDEELARMSTIADQLSPHAIILFNESFAGTNEREGSEIARQIVEALLEDEIKVLFVTHRFPFAERFLERRTSSALFLRAERLSDGRRSYKLVAKEPLSTSFAEDLYSSLGAWLDTDRPISAG